MPPSIEVYVLLNMVVKLSKPSIIRLQWLFQILLKDNWILIFGFDCRYDPRKYVGRDEDDSDMEADFATIEREEKRRY